MVAGEAGHHDLSPGGVALSASMVGVLVLGAGLMSGLTLGLLSLDVMDLKVSLSKFKKSVLV